VASLASPANGLASRAGLARLLALLMPAALLGGALGSQFLGGLYPCEMCYWQRWPHAAAIVAAGAAFLFPAGDRRARGLTASAALAVAISGAIGVFHAGVELGWWEGLTRCATTGAATLEDIFAVPLVRCDQVQWSFIGISMAGWNAILSLGTAAVVAVLLLGKARA
jgi:disulfide bond formation protein DsbB